MAGTIGPSLLLEVGTTFSPIVLEYVGAARSGTGAGCAMTLG